MTEQEANAMLESLSAKFNVKQPTIEWKNVRRAFANYRANKIVVSMNAWAGLAATLVHEFAHILTYNKYPNVLERCVNTGSGAMRFRNKIRHHGIEFKQCLEEVIVAHYGRLDLYPWHTEYSTVKAYGARAVKNDPNDFVAVARRGKQYAEFNCPNCQQIITGPWSFKQHLINKHHVNEQIAVEIRRRLK